VKKKRPIKHPMETISLVGNFNLIEARNPQSWPAFVPKPEADSVVHVRKHPVLLPLEVQQYLYAVEDAAVWMRLDDTFGWMESTAFMLSSQKTMYPTGMKWTLEIAWIDFGARRFARL